MNDKIPIGKYRLMRKSSGEYFHTVIIRFRDGVKIKDEDIVTLDMIEPYEPDAVRKVAEYLKDKFSSYYEDSYYINYAKTIVDLVQESEDADE